MAKSRICSIDTCDKPHARHGYCAKHAYRFVKYGNPIATQRPKKSSRCGVLVCKKPVKKNGYCTTHLNRWQAHGDPLFTLTASHFDRRDFIDTALRSDTDECIFWPYGKDDQGRGVITVDGWDGRVHRLVCQKKHGYPPLDKPSALHKCGQGHKGCINPKHLYWGTQQDNVNDMISHGTMCVGENRPNSKISDADIPTIRKSRYIVPAQRLADQYGVSRSQIYAIQSGRARKHN